MDISKATSCFSSENLFIKLEITTVHRKQLAEILGIIAGNKLYKPDYVTKKQMGLIGFSHNTL